MKALGLFGLLFVFACALDEAPPYHKLEGDWTRININEFEKTTEHWEEVNSIDLREKLKGIGQSYFDDSLVFQENLSIICDKNNRYFYIVEGVNAEPTYFEISEWSDTSFLAFNDWNEFPKYIEYTFKKDSMFVNIGDSSRSVEFNFVRMD